MPRQPPCAFKTFTLISWLTSFLCGIEIKGKVLSKGVIQTSHCLPLAVDSMGMQAGIALAAYHLVTVVLLMFDENSVMPKGLPTVLALKE